MVIELAFTINREVIRFRIENKVITYIDRKWQQGIQFMPKDQKMIIKLLSSRNRFPMAYQIINWINEANSGKNLQEYNACDTDEKIAEIVRKDAKLKGLLEVKAK